MTLNDMHIAALIAERNTNPLNSDFLSIAAYVSTCAKIDYLDRVEVHTDNAKEMLTRVSDAVLEYLVLQFAKPSLPGYPATNPHLQEIKKLAREWVHAEYHRRHHREVREPVGEYAFPGLTGTLPVYDFEHDGDYILIRNLGEFAWIRTPASNVTLY